MDRCTMPPAGWYCTRTPGHDGPCAAHPSDDYGASSGWASPTLGRIYEDVDKLRSDLAQHPESGIDESLRRLLEAIEEADVELAGLAA